jgi:hypothetical protein
MSQEKKKRWSGRAFTSLSMTLSFAVLILSSVILYVMPAGRDAYWSDWKYWGLDKDQWGALHTVGGLAFVLFGLVHLVLYNWKTFWNYVVSRIRKHLNRRIEIAAAVVVNVLVVVFCVNGWAPASTIMGWGTSFKEGWVQTAQKPPIPHAELETLRSLSEKIDFDLPGALKALEEKGISADPDKTLQFLAREEGMSPAEFYGLISSFRSGGTGGGPDSLAEGAGWGAKTVKMVSDEFGVPLEEALRKLRGRGVEAEGGDNLRALSGEAGITPIELARIIKEEEK